MDLPVRRGRESTDRRAVSYTHLDVYKRQTKTRYVQLVAELAQEIFVRHYTKLTPKVAAALAEKYQSDILTDDEIHSGVINYFLKMCIRDRHWTKTRCR